MLAASLMIAIVATAGCAGSTANAVPDGSAQQRLRPRTTVPARVVGVVQDADTHRAIAGATVIVGGIPNLLTCIGYRGCGQPIVPHFTAVTDSIGRFSLEGLSLGSWFLQVSHGSTYAILHERANLYGGTAYLGTLRISKLRPYESTMLRILNHDRETISYPRTPGNLVQDEFALEQDRAWQDDVAGGSIPWEDPHYSAPANAIGPGSLPGSSVEFYCCLDLTLGMDAYFSQKRFCPNNGNWSTCPFYNASNYIVLSSDTDAWVGFTHSVKPGAHDGLYDQGGIILGGYGSRY